MRKKRTIERTNRIGRFFGVSIEPFDRLQIQPWHLGGLLFFINDFSFENDIVWVVVCWWWQRFQRLSVRFVLCGSVDWLSGNNGFQGFGRGGWKELNECCCDFLGFLFFFVIIIIIICFGGLALFFCFQRENLNWVSSSTLFCSAHTSLLANCLLRFFTGLWP